ncbi:hypothetical protein EBU99_13560 [bacterium]|nr:hypothetical protein [bacterium]
MRVHPFVFFLCVLAFGTWTFSPWSTSARAASKPEWVDTGRHPKYPNSIFLVGVGTAREQLDAESNALSSIGKQIRVSVETASRSEVSAFGERVSSYFNQSVSVDSSENLQGVRFVERYKSDDDLWSVLAVVKVSDLALVRQGNLSECVERALKLKPTVRKDEGIISPSEIFFSSIGLLVRRPECLRRLAELRTIETIASAAQKMAENEGRSALTRRVQELDAVVEAAQLNLKKLTFRTSCEKKLERESEKMRAGLESQSGICLNFERVLVDFGLKKVQDESAFEIKIKYVLREKKSSSPTLTFLHAGVSLEVVETAKKSVFFETAADDEAGGASPSSALSKLDKKLGEKLTSAFVQKFNNKE